MAEDVTELLLQWSQGNREALDELMPLVTGQLRELARSHLRGERLGHTLQPTALVNEVYLRLVDRRRVSWQSRAQFFGFAASTMRRILVDYARARRTAKRGAGVEPITLDETVGLTTGKGIDVIALDEALKSLAQLDERQSRLVELRFFAGLTVEETAEVLGIGTATVVRDWSTAKAWLYAQLTGA